MFLVQVNGLPAVSQLQNGCNSSEPLPTPGRGAEMVFELQSLSEKISVTFIRQCAADF